MQEKSLSVRKRWSFYYLVGSGNDYVKDDEIYKIKACWTGPRRGVT